MNYLINWIPAFAGMTNCVFFAHFETVAKLGTVS